MVFQTIQKIETYPLAVDVALFKRLAKLFISRESITIGKPCEPYLKRLEWALR